MNDALPFDQETEDEIDAALREIDAITDYRQREMALAELNKRYRPYLTARLNDDINP